MNNFKNFILTELEHKKIYKLLMIYLILGTYIYVKEYSDLSYINFVYIGIFHPYILSFFLLPSILTMSLYIIHVIGNNKNIIGRFGSKKKFYLFEIKIIFIELSKMFLIFCLTLLLCANLYANRNSLILPDPNYPHVLNLIGLLFSLVKLYIFVLLMGLFTITINTIFDIKIFLIFSFITIFSFLDFIPLGNLEIILPSYYIGFKHIFSSFSLNILCTSTYFLIINLIIYIIFKKILFRKDIL